MGKLFGGLFFAGIALASMPDALGARGDAEAVPCTSESKAFFNLMNGAIRHPGEPPAEAATLLHSKVLPEPASPDQPDGAQGATAGAASG